MKNLLLILILSLVGCATQPPGVPPAVESTKKVEIDASLLKECPVATKLSDTSDLAVLDEIKSLLDLYQACRTNKSKLNAIVKDAFNLNTK